MQTLTTIEKTIKRNIENGLETRLIVERVNSVVKTTDVKTDFYDSMGNRLRFMKRSINDYEEEFVRIERINNGELKKVSQCLTKDEFNLEIRKWVKRGLLKLTSHAEMYNSFSDLPWLIDFQRFWVLDRNSHAIKSFYSIEFEGLKEWEKLKPHIKSGRVKGIQIMPTKSIFDYMKQ
jgi:CRISPR/Cas system-associated exonuclease Cas4 (RecB family)